MRDRNLQATERTLFGRYTVKVPKAYEDSTIVTKAPLALDMVNSITAALTVNPPEVKFEPVASGQRGPEQRRTAGEVLLGVLDAPGAGGGAPALPGLRLGRGGLRRRNH